MSVEKYDGGPAFPTPEGHEREKYYGSHPGMSRRDYFASQVIIGLLSKNVGSNNVSAEEIVQKAFVLADEMILLSDETTRVDDDRRVP